MASGSDQVAAVVAARTWRLIGQDGHPKGALLGSRLGGEGIPLHDQDEVLVRSMLIWLAEARAAPTPSSRGPKRCLFGGTLPEISPDTKHSLAEAIAGCQTVAPRNLVV